MTFLTPDAPRRRPLAGGRGGPRAGALLDRQPGHQRHHGALLAERGLHGVGRAAASLEALHGEEAAVLGWAIGAEGARQELERFGAGLAAHASAHRARRHRPRRRLLLRALREGRALPDPARARRWGAPRFDRFMRDYMARFRFTSITHGGVPRVPGEQLPGRGRRRWTPARGSTSRACPRTRRSSAPRGSTASSRLGRGLAGRRAASAASRSPAGAPPRCSSTSRTCRASSTRDGCAWLDAALGLTGRGNHEILVEWLTIAGGSDYEPAFAPAARGAAAGGPDEVPAAALRRARPAPAHARAGPRGLRRGRARLPRAVAPRGRVRDRQVRRRAAS